MFESKDTGDSIELRIAVGFIIMLLGAIILQLVTINKTLKAQPTEFIQKLHVEMNP